MQFITLECEGGDAKPSEELYVSGAYGSTLWDCHPLGLIGADREWGKASILTPAPDKRAEAPKKRAPGLNKH